MTATPAEAARSDRDPITLEIIKNAFSMVAEEMGITVVRSAFSTWIKESADASTAIFDAEGRLIAQSETTFLAHLASLRSSIGAVLADHPVEQMRPGDVFAMNDPARGGIHANDIEIFQPVFADGRVAFFTAALVHVADLGAVTAGGLPAQATEIWHEGLLIPPSTLYREGTPNLELFRLIELNSRTPEMVTGDIRALVSGCSVGAERLHALVERYSLPVLERVVHDVFDYTEQLTRAAIERLAEGTFRGEFVIDDDGIDLDRAYRVVVTVQREGADLVLDLTGTDPQARGAINASYSQATSGLLFGARCFLDPSLPMNEGFLRPLRLVLPEGSLVRPGRTAALNARIVTIYAIVDAVIAALSQQRPELATASPGLVHLFTASGADAAGRRWIDILSDFGGFGARYGKDGVDADGAYLFAGRGMTKQIEGSEVAGITLICERSELVPDSGGPGAYRGGLGLDVVYRAANDVEISVRADRMRIPPPGVNGGSSGRPGRWTVNGGRIDEQVLASKEMGIRLRPGDTITMRTSGGGGYGPPWRRPAEQVRADVMAGHVSRDGAEQDYGVVLDADLALDEVATGARRARMERAGAAP